MSQTIIPTDLYVAGNVSSKTLTLPAGSVTDSGVAAGAGIQATKLTHQPMPHFAQDSTVNATAETKVIYAVNGASATIVGFAAGAVVPAVGNATCTVDCRKNGTSILAAPVSLTNAQTARELVAASLATTASVAGDVYEVVVTPTVGTGTLAQGIFAHLILQESAQ